MFNFNPIRNGENLVVKWKCAAVVPICHVQKIRDKLYINEITEIPSKTRLSLFINLQNVDFARVKT